MSLQLNLIATPLEEIIEIESNAKMEGFVRGLGTYYSNGREGLEIHIPKDSAEALPYVDNHRIAVELRLGRSSYTAGLRATPNNKYVWISPDLVSSEGERISLARLLEDNGFAKNDRVVLEITGRRIMLRRSDKTTDQRTRVRRAGQSVDQRMRDPLENFDWDSLYEKYDEKCTAYSSNATALECFPERPGTDRELYYSLVQRIREERINQSLMTLVTYQAVIYWKLYSTSQKINNDIRDREEIRRDLQNSLPLISNFPERMSRESSEIIELIKRIRELRLYGTRSGLPVPITVLHFLYPEVVPIFDKMVLQAVGVQESGANQRLDVFEEYLPFAWGLCDRYARQLEQFRMETPIRIVDMALWVIRDQKST